MFALALTCFLQSKEVFSESKEVRGESKEVVDYSAEPDKVKRVLLNASLLQQRFDVNSSLQVKPRRMFDCVAFSLDLHNRDHVKPLELLISFRFKLSSIRGILPNLIEDHVKCCIELPCSDAVT